jgi:hypothetical protein
MKSFKSSIFLFLIFTATALWAWGLGDRCLGQWSDGYWYPATIVSAEEDVYNVAFDDGDSAVFQIRRLDQLTGELDLQSNATGRVEEAIIRQNYKKSGDSIHVSYDDGDEEDTTIGKCRSIP